MTSESANAVSATESPKLHEASQDLDKLLRDTRRRLYAAAAAADYEMLGEVQSLPDSEIEAMERASAADSGQQNWTTGVQWLALPVRTLLAVRGRRKRVRHEYLKGRDITDPPARTQYTRRRRR